MTAGLPGFARGRGRGLSLVLAGLLVGGAGGCKKGDASGAATDGGLGADGPVLCTMADAGAVVGAGDGAASASSRTDAAAESGGATGSGAFTDDFGPNTAPSKTTSSLGRVNIYEVTTPSWLQRVDVYLGAALEHTRLTIAVHEATGRDSAFTKRLDVQVDFGTCVGWASTGAVSLALEAGHFYAIGFDPNQAITPFVSSDPDTLPIDGAFGRLVGSKTATSVSVDSLTWDKVTDKELNRQRLTTAPRAAAAPTDGAAIGDGAAAADARVGGTAAITDAGTKS